MRVVLSQARARSYLSSFFPYFIAHFSPVHVLACVTANDGEERQERRYAVTPSTRSFNTVLSVLFLRKHVLPFTCFVWITLPEMRKNVNMEITLEPYRNSNYIIQFPEYFLAFLIRNVLISFFSRFHNISIWAIWAFTRYWGSNTKLLPR